MLMCRHPRIYEFYKFAVASFWTVEEVDLSQDMRDWLKLSSTSHPSLTSSFHVVAEYQPFSTFASQVLEGVC